MKAVDRPIFIVGTGRSGTSLLMRLFANHPETCWISTLTDRFPRLPQLALLSRAWHRLDDEARRRRWWLRPSFPPSDESTGVYGYAGCRRLLFELGRPLAAEDVEPRARRRLRYVVREHLRWTGREAFVDKNTNNPMRIPYLREIFPEAVFVHLVRDGRAVVASILRTHWWRDLRLWWSGSTPREMEAAGEEPVEVAARHCRLERQAVLDARQDLEAEGFVELRYEDLVRDPGASAEELFRACGLCWSVEVRDLVLREEIRSPRSDWTTRFDEREARIVTGILEDQLLEYGYLDGPDREPVASGE